jgi:hypothetical protein
MPALFARFSRPRLRASRAQEPADMGTAFGMEQWLDECDRPAAPARRPDPARPGARWLPSWLPSWLQPGTLRRLRH